MALEQRYRHDLGLPLGPLFLIVAALSGARLLAAQSDSLGMGEWRSSLLTDTATPFGQPVLSLGVRASLDSAPLGVGGAASDSASGNSGKLPPPHTQPQFWWALGEVGLGNLLTWGHYYLSDVGWAHITPQSWGQNLGNDWVWDEDSFYTNQFSHPVLGGMYFNSARTNGFSFWGSTPFVFVGSLMWEYLGETNAPALNDQITTTIGGMTYGEVAFRLSAYVLDNSATGIDRLWREVATVLVDPGREIHRLIHGQAWRVTDRTVDPGHQPLTSSFATGARRLYPGPASWQSSAVSDGQIVLQASFAYGDPFGPHDRTPFTVFDAEIEVATYPVKLSNLNISGLLARPMNRRSANTANMLGLYLASEYQSNPAYQFSSQALRLQLLTQRGTARGLSLRAGLGLSGVFLGAATDAYATAAVRRAYDYGPGLGATASASLRFMGAPVLSVGYQTDWLYTVNGPSTDQWMQAARIELRTPRVAGAHAGASYEAFWQRNAYSDQATVKQTGSQVSVFLGVGGG